MITGLDPIVLITSDLDAGVAAYRTVVAREPSSRSAGSALFTLDNTALELLGPAAEGVPAALAAGGEGRASLCFGVDDLAKAHNKLERRGLNPGAIAEAGGARHFRTDKTRTHGIRHFFIQRDTPLAASAAGTGGATRGWSDQWGACSATSPASSSGRTVVSGVRPVHHSSSTVQPMALAAAPATGDILARSRT